MRTPGKQPLTNSERYRLRLALDRQRNHPNIYPLLADYGLMERTPDGFKAIDPDKVYSLCRELLATRKDRE